MPRRLLVFTSPSSPGLGLMAAGVLTCLALALWPLASEAQAVSYPVEDTGQTDCYDAASAIECPSQGQPFYGQDSQHEGRPPSFTASADGLTVHDNVTGLTWQKSPQTNGDGVLDSSDKLTYAEALARPSTLNALDFGGFDDWRVPTIKELYSLIDFRGTDPMATGTDTSGLTPFIDRGYFDFVYGDPGAGERIIDAQYWSSTTYVSTTMGGSITQFGVNFADGRIKGYPRDTGPSGTANRQFLRCVRGNPDYGQNAFEDNGDGTVTDAATGLMWSKEDSGSGMSWEEALAWVQEKNAASYQGYSDWRLPDAKELQSILDYSRSPDTTGSAAVDPDLDCTPITNEGGEPDYPWYWASTTHLSSITGATAGVYVCFGRALGWMRLQGDSCYTLLDVHGAGAQRSDPKSGSPGGYFLGFSCTGQPAYGRGPQGDVVRVENFVRLVRDAGTAPEPLTATFSFAPSDPTDAAVTTFAASAKGGTLPYDYSWDVDGASFTGPSLALTLTQGRHEVSLTVTDFEGTQATHEETVQVGASVRIGSVVQLSNPFRLKVLGEGFSPGCVVEIDGVPAPRTVFKNETVVKAKGGASLKALLPPGISVSIVVVNPDGRTSAPFPCTR